MRDRDSMKRSNIFISSVQKEFLEERAAIRDFVRGDALLRRFFDVFLFEEIPASDRKPDDVYLDEVDRCGVYVGLFGKEYGSPGTNGRSPTELEFDRATAKHKTRLIFVKGSDDKVRHPKMLKLIQSAGAQLIRRRFSDIPDLTAALYSALVEHLEKSGALRTLPFDASACDRATLDDLSDEKLRWFLGTTARKGT
jgi:ATP-dependent DNA helicase RecG